MRTLDIFPVVVLLGLELALDQLLADLLVKLEAALEQSEDRLALERAVDCLQVDLLDHLVLVDELLDTLDFDQIELAEGPIAALEDRANLNFIPLTELELPVEVPKTRQEVEAALVIWPHFLQQVV